MTVYSYIFPVLWGASWTVFFLTWVRDDACSWVWPWPVRVTDQWIGTACPHWLRSTQRCYQAQLLFSFLFEKFSCFCTWSSFLLHLWWKQNSQVFISWFAALPRNRDELKPSGWEADVGTPILLLKKHNPLKKHWSTPEITTLNVGISWPLTIFSPSLFRGPNRHKHEWDWNGRHPWTLL